MLRRVFLTAWLLELPLDQVEFIDNEPSQQLLLTKVMSENSLWAQVSAGITGVSH